MQVVWFAILMATVCLEGLGRKYLPAIPSAAFYFLKDPVLLYGYYRYRPNESVRRSVRMLYKGFGVFWVIGFAWTVIELFNPGQGSFLLGLIGLRAYWLWWIAPPLIAAMLQEEKAKRNAIYVLAAMTIGIAVLAALQFASSPTSALNLYSVVDGQEVYAADMATVSTTGRARVASTFSFVSGFHDFSLLVPALLLSLGLEAKDFRLRWCALGATFASAAAIPMSGSRASVLLGAAVLLVTAWTSGLFLTRIGRRILIGGVLAAGVAMYAFPDAILGVESRFENQEETNLRYLWATEGFLPPVALARVDYPIMGVGTGMQQNARISMHVPDTQYTDELETGRYLVELGPIGFLAIWLTKVGLVVALFRSYKLLKRAGRRGAAAAAMSYAVLTLNGNLTFDHVWQALYFIGCGFILAEVASLSRAKAAAPVAEIPRTTRQPFRGEVTAAQPGIGAG